MLRQTYTKNVINDSCYYSLRVRSKQNYLKDFGYVLKFCTHQRYFYLHCKLQRRTWNEETNGACDSQLVGGKAERGTQEPQRLVIEAGMRRKECDRKKIK